MKYLKPTIRLVIALSLSYALMYFGAKIGDAMKFKAVADIAQAQAAIADAKAREAKSLSEVAQFNAINTYWALQKERTDIETANRKVVMAEYRLAAVCKRSKVKC